MEGVVAVGGASPADHSDGVFLEEASEVQEVGFLAIGVEHGAGAVLEVSGREDSDAVFWEAVGQVGPAVGILLSRDAGGD